MQRFVSNEVLVDVAETFQVFSGAAVQTVWSVYDT